MTDTHRRSVPATISGHTTLPLSSRAQARRGYANLGAQDAIRGRSGDAVGPPLAR